VARSQTNPVHRSTRPTKNPPRGGFRSGKEARPGCYGARPDPKLGMVGAEKGKGAMKLDLTPFGFRERVGRIRKNKTRLAAGLGVEKGKGAMKLDLTPFGRTRPTKNPPRGGFRSGKEARSCAMELDLTPSCGC